MEQNKICEPEAKRTKHASQRRSPWSPWSMRANGEARRARSKSFFSLVRGL